MYLWQRVIRAAMAYEPKPVCAHGLSMLVLQ